MKEKYYAVRIGDPRYHYPYLMLSDDRKTPSLFFTRERAEQAIKDTPDIDRTARVVVTTIHFGKEQP